MTVWTLYIAKPAPPSTTSGQGSFQTPVVQGLTIDDTNILTANPGLRGPGPSTVSSSNLYLQRWLYEMGQARVDGAFGHGYRFLLSSDGGTTFLAPDN